MITLSYRIDGGDFDAAGLATRRLKEQLARIGVEASAMRRAMIAAYEAEMNVVIHARTGTLWARLDNGRLDLEIADEGPGIPDVESALREGWSTASDRARQMGFGAGMGLPNIRRNSDLFEIETRVGRGTRIRSTIVLERSAAAPSGPRGVGQLEEAAVAAPLAIDCSRCRRCMRCVRACPTGALRVRREGPMLVGALCVGCALCAAECGNGVFGVAEEGIGDVDALPVVPADAVLVLPHGYLSGLAIDDAPARVLSALRRLGFHDVRLLDEWVDALRKEAGTLARADAGTGAGTGGAPAPLIPPLCPPAVTLVESRFPSLIPQLGAWLSPAEAAGEEFPLRPVVLVAACPGQYAAARRASLTDRLTVLSPARLTRAVRPLLAAGGDPVSRPAFAGHAAGWDAGETAGRGAGRAADRGAMTVHGPRHMMRVLAEAEAGRLHGVSLLELFFCEGGCSGSPLLASEVLLSEQRWRESAALEGGAGDSAGTVPRTRPYSQRYGVRLHADMGKAIETLGRIDALARTLPGHDCAACGAPTCAAFAEDTVLHRAGDARCPHAEETA